MGEDAQGEAVVTVEYNARTYRGTSVTTDIVESAVRAFLAVVNQIEATAAAAASSRRRTPRRLGRRRRLTPGYMGATPSTLFDKVWDRHVVVPESADTPAVLYIDLHLIHEVTSPQAFDVLRSRGLGGAATRPDARDDGPLDADGPGAGRRSCADRHRVRGAAGPAARAQLRRVRRRAARHARRTARDRAHHRAGTRGSRSPGKTIVCGDSHTSTHGAFGALAFGIGTTEVGHVLATQCLLQRKPRTLALTISGRLSARRHGEGPDPRSHRAHRRQRRHRARDRVSRQRDRGAVDGRAHDRLQHVDRGRRARRHDRAGRDDVRLPARATARADGRGLGAARSTTGDRCTPTPAQASTAR